jgi:hypothetical protein
MNPALYLLLFFNSYNGNGALEVIPQVTMEQCLENGEIAKRMSNKLQFKCLTGARQPQVD